MKDTTTEDLFLYMSFKGDGSKEPELAFNEFHSRFKRYVWGAVHRIGKSKELLQNHPTGKQDLFSDTLLAAYDKASDFNPETKDNYDKKVMLWLSGIIKIQYLRWEQEVLKHDKKQKLLSYVDELPELAIETHVDKDLEDRVETIPIQQLHRAMDTILSDKEREILLAWFMFAPIHTDEKQRSPIPKSHRDRLCQVYGLKPDSLRQIKNRALKKIKQALTANHAVMVPLKR
ncbi:MAG TPA: sigma-70 family RNA polymerase sigma factor [Saprospiraceae bacterium]|nr:sigma-70 family RNA polymerase sigma factor [Saprospiraceae bacterium]